MAISSLTVTIAEPRVIDGFVTQFNLENQGRESPRILQEFVDGQVKTLGRNYANSRRVGVISSSAFILRFTGQELAAIKAAATQSAELAGLLAELAANPEVFLDDPRLLPGLQQLTAAGLLAEGRIAELLAYDRPEVA